MNSPLDRMIRIGTLINKGSKDPEYLRQIVLHGFESFQVTFWQHLDGLDLPSHAAAVRNALDGHDAIISSIGVFGNPLGETEIDALTRKGLEAAIDAANDYGAKFVCGFSGRVRQKSVPDSMARFKEVWAPLMERAAKRGVRIAFENCPMGGDWNSGDWNVAFNPDAWELMAAALPFEEFGWGLEWEPCHQMGQLIDPVAQLRAWAPHVLHLHGKDASLYPDRLATGGYMGAKPHFEHRHPGFGDTNWSDIFSILRAAGYQGTVDIEGWHDPVYRDDLELTGQVHALRYLQRARGGSFVPNPVL